jgi:hypothetical protein
MPRAARITQDGLTMKEEQFCDAFLVSGDASQSYRAAYNASPRRSGGWVRREAYRLLHKPHIRSRIEALRKKTEASAVYTANEAFRDAGMAFDLARNHEQPSAMVSAVTLRARLAGLMVDKQEVTEMRKLRDVPSAELERLLVESAREAGFVITLANGKMPGNS